MTRILRRCLVLAALAFWQGGFSFYATVVVPVGQEVLGSHRDQGFVTRNVTNYLNFAGGIALLPLAWDAWFPGGTVRRWQRVRRLAWGGMGIALVALIWLHVRLDALLEPQGANILDPKTFYGVHRWYLWASAFQFGCAVIYGVLAVSGWHDEDRAGLNRG